LRGRLRAVHAVAGLDPAHGGPSYSVPRLCEALAGIGAEVVLLSVGSGGDNQADAREGTYCDRRFAADYAAVPVLGNLRRSSGLSHALFESAVAADLIHNHGLWLMPNIEAGRAARRAGKPLILSPRGMLAPAALAFSRRRKRLFWRLLQGRGVRQAACLHATSEEEYGEIRGFGLSNPVAVIPNGIDLPEPTAGKMGKERIVLSLGRIHPKKGLDRLVRAWAQVERRFPDWRLRVVGPAEGGHDEALRALAISLGLSRISIEGPVYGEDKSRAYRACELFVQPTANENFGLTVAEALACELPAISTKGAPWSGLSAEGCGWWIEHGVEPLAAALATAMTLPPDALRAMGARGRAWMARDFSWDRVARDMLGVYRWLIGEIAAPETVRFL
jgi:glycosyltransferase involved in cell wall biosynthesis